MSQQLKVSIFLSSPTDVQPEREAAERVVSRLGGIYAAHVELTLERWERRFYEASQGFQEAIAAMESFDVVVGVLWKRIGSELPPNKFSRPDGTPFESGTVYEIETALAANQHSTRPTVYVFKSTRPVTFTEERVEEERAQKQALDRWWARTFRDAEGHYIAAANEFGTTEDFETKFEDCLVGWLAEKGHIPSGPVWDVAIQGSPYPGLVAYDRDRSPVFFGRQLAVDHARDELLAAATREDGFPALFVIGASGSGKSSLVRAGLVPRLTRPGTVPGVDLWRIVITVPAADSLAALAAHLYATNGLPELAASTQGYPERWGRMAAGSPEAAADSIAWALARAAETERQRTRANRTLQVRLLLVVDQLESLFGTPGQGAFTRVLQAFVEGGKVWLLATLRSDRYAELQLDPGLLALKRVGATYDLPPPGPAEITDIIKGPARAAGLTFAEYEGTSLARVLVEAAPNADALPLLQMSLAQLFEQRDGTELTFTAYEAMGEVDGAIATHANSAFDQAPPAAQRELDPLVRELVRDVTRTSDGQVRFTARVADRNVFETNAARRDLIEKLVNGRLLVSDGSDLRVAHEALLRRWNRSRDSLRRLADAALRKARLRMFRAYAAAIVFLLVAGGAVGLWFEAERQAKIARQELDRRLEADTARLAQAARRQTDEGRPELGIQLGIIALASHAEARTPPPSRWRAIDALAWSISASPVPVANLRHKEWIMQTAFSPDGQKVVTASADGIIRLWDARTGRELLVLPHEGSLVRAAFSPDGQKLLTASSSRLHVWDTATGGQLTTHGYADERVELFSPDGQKILITSAGTVRLLDTNDGRELLTLRHGRPIYTAQFSPNGRKIATFSADGSLRVWDATSGDELAAFRAHEKTIFSLVFSSDAQKILTASEDGTARLWDAEEGRELFAVRHQGAVASAAFSPDARTILTASEDGTAQLWDATAGTKLTTFQHEYGGYAILRAVFSPNGQQVLTVATDKTARLWDMGTGAELAVLRHEQWLSSAIFSPDGRKVLTTPLQEEYTVRLWDVGNGREVLALQHPDDLWNARLSRDGSRVITASSDGAARLWDTVTGGEVLVVRHQRPVRTATLSPDGRKVLTASEDGTARLWDAATGAALAAFPHGAVVSTAFFGADGRKVLTASEDGTARLWEADTGRELLVLHHQGEVYGAFFSTDGKKVLTISQHRVIVDRQKETVTYALAAQLWDAESGRERLALRPEGVLRMAKLSPDGQKLVIALEDGTARVLDAASAKELSVLRGHEGPVGDVSFSPDGQKIVTVSKDQTVRLWDAATGVQLTVLRGHERSISGANFSPDGRSLLTASADGTARVWDTATGAVLAVLHGHKGEPRPVGFSQDGFKVLTRSERVVRLWSLPTYRSLDGLVAYAKALALPPLSEAQCREFGILPERCIWLPS